VQSSDIQVGFKFQIGITSVENIENLRCLSVMDRNVIQIWNVFMKKDIPLFMSWLIRWESYLDHAKEF
jgi:hypothetical protein